MKMENTEFCNKKGIFSNWPDVTKQLFKFLRIYVLWFILSLVKILFSFVSNSLSYITHTPKL